MKFNLTIKELEKALKFARKSQNDNNPFGAIQMKITSGGGIGSIVKVKDRNTGKVKNITDWESW